MSILHNTYTVNIGKRTHTHLALEVIICIFVEVPELLDLDQSPCQTFICVKTEKPEAASKFTVKVE